MTWGGKTRGLSRARATLSYQGTSMWPSERSGAGGHMGLATPAACRLGRRAVRNAPSPDYLVTSPIPGVMRRNNPGWITFLPQSASRQNGFMLKVPCGSQVLGICNLTLLQRVRKVTPTQQAWLLKNRLHLEFSKAKKALACTQH